MKKNIYEIIGWYGVIAILLAYGLITFHLVTAKSLIFQLLNLTGALGIIVDAYKDNNIQPVVLNTIWMLIALIAIIQILFL